MELGYDRVIFEDDIDFETAILDELLIAKQQYEKGRNKSIKMKLTGVFAGALLLTASYNGLRLVYSERISIPLTNIGVEKVYNGTKTYLAENGQKKQIPVLIDKSKEDKLFYYSDWRKDLTGGPDYREVYAVLLDDQDNPNKQKDINSPILITETISDCDELIKDRKKMGSIFSEILSDENSSDSNDKYKGAQYYILKKTATNDPNNDSDKKAILEHPELYNAPADSFGIIDYQKIDDGTWQPIKEIDLVDIIFLAAMSSCAIMLTLLYSASKIGDTKKYNNITKKQYKQICRTLKQRNNQ